MKILLDECVDWRLKNDFAKVTVSTVQEQGWLGRKNGELLRSAVSAGFDVFVTIDQNLRFQQNLSELPIAVVILKAHRSNLRSLRPLAPKVIEALNKAKPGEILIVD